ncbi:MAG: hypothetical protein AAFO95_10720 [Cyanobacteria bacterium J06600_6]
MTSTYRKINSWLDKMLNSRANGILLSSESSDSFEAIQDYLETIEHPVQTNAIYYRAFADDNLDELLATLEEELRLKLGFASSQSCSTLSEVIALAELKTVVIDQSHLYAKEMIDGLCEWLFENQVNLVFVASKTEVYASDFLNHPILSQWETFVACADLPITLASGCSNLVV